MAYAVLLLCLVGASVAQFQTAQFQPPQQFQPAQFQPAQFQVQTKVVPYVTFRHHQQDDAGQFTSSHQGSDGQTHQETGTLKLNRAGDGHVLVKKGYYSYTAPDGRLVRVDYTADEDGFRPTGDVIPVAPVANPAVF